MMRHLLIILLLPILPLNASADVRQADGSEPTLQQYEQALMFFSDSLINAGSEEQRAAASMQMIKVLSRALRKPGSFDYPFEQLQSVAIVRPADDKFRMLTWQLAFDNGTYRYYGVIQMNEPEPKIFPLVDYGSFYENPDSIIVDHDRWIGALYYNIIPQSAGKKTYYTLFGWNANNVISNKKLIDILWFDEEGKPKLGYPIFEMIKGVSPTRIIFEYKKDATMSLTYIPEELTIYYDHLVQLGGKETDFKFDQVPDGTLEGFVWKKGKWQQIEMIDYEKREEGDVPNVIEEQKQPLYRPLQPR
jgi:hypothetical protein